MQLSRLELVQHADPREAGQGVALEERTERVLLACCGQWQAVMTLPHVCGRCGATYLGEKHGATWYDLPGDDFDG